MRIDEWIQNVTRFLRLTHEQESTEVIHESIEKAIVFRGTNLWILIFAILVASVGLNMNSPAVIIGAMLISPLMGPITGIGYSVATYNIDLLKRSLKNLGFASAAGLVTSMLYFMLSPISSEQSELLARTSPTIYDVLIATFGGLAGIVAISSKNKGNVIPGVAIATALMPPLCTAGYGIATGHWDYLAGALYLFLINSVFIALSAMVVTQLLKLPKKSFLHSKEIKNKNILIAIVVAVTVVPSVYLGATLVDKEHFQKDAEHFVNQVGIWDENYLIRHDINSDARVITLIYSGNSIDKLSEERLLQKAKDLRLEDCKINIKQGAKLSEGRAQTESNAQLSEINRLRSALIHKEKLVDSLNAIPKTGGSLLKEIKTLYPQVQACSYVNTFRYVDSLKQPQPTCVVLIESVDSVKMVDRIKLDAWLKQRLNTDHLVVKF